MSNFQSVNIRCAPGAEEELNRVLSNFLTSEDRIWTVTTGTNKSIDVTFTHNGGQPLYFYAKACRQLDEENEMLVNIAEKGLTLTYW